MPVSMPQFRFPFTKKASHATPSTPAEEQVVVPETAPAEQSAPSTHTRAKSTSSISIISRRSREDDNNIYQLSVVNDSGEYIPPSPVEKKGFWGRTNSTASSTKEVPDTEELGFAITRESFDSYRRSFDISARTPVSESQRHSLQSSRSSFDALGWGRPSFDSKMGVPNRLPSIDVSETTSEEEGDEEFRDVDLNENTAPQQKKKSFLGRFVGGHSAEEEPKGRNRSSSTAWRREHNKDAEELSAMVKGSNHLISV